ncbi:MAG: alpha/beta hydrolase fold domain-containing protein [Sterolibacterium sp.]
MTLCLTLSSCGGGGATQGATQPAAEPGRYISPQYTTGQLTTYTDVIYSTRPNVGGSQYTSDINMPKELGGAVLNLKLDVGVPPNATAANPQPLIILIHGGGFSAGGKEDYRQAALSYARAGYVAATINYRLTPNNINNATARLTAITNASDDAMNAIRYLKANAALYHIDATRTATIGNSAGGGISLINAIEFDTFPNTVSDYPGVSSQVAAAIATGATLIDRTANFDSYLRYQATDTPVLLFHANPTDSITGATWVGNVLPTQSRIDASGNTCGVVAQADMTHVVDLSPDGIWWSSLKPFLWDRLRLASMP